jgi:hypothetical protein
MKRITLTLLTLILTLVSYSQSKTQFTLTLKDGDVVTGITKISKISLITDYGKLEIPIKNVNSIEIGLHPDNSLKSEIKKVADQLNNTNKEMRASAYKSLIEMEAGAIPVIENIMYSLEYSSGEYTEYTLSNAINELKANYNVKSNYKTRDVVSIDYEHNMGGVYTFKTIELKTEYGTLNIPREKIEKIDVLFFDENELNGMKVYKLFAATHISSNNTSGWLKTGVMVKTGQNISIVANGEVTLASLSNNKYKPDGSNKTTYDADFKPNTSTSTYPAYGNVVYKIGETGTSKKTGAKFNGKADANGMLYLSIHETVYNASNTGFYIVNLKVK